LDKLLIQKIKNNSVQCVSRTQYGAIGTPLLYLRLFPLLHDPVRRFSEVRFMGRWRKFSSGRNSRNARIPGRAHIDLNSLFQKELRGWAA
jgi:hypothetical protein